MNTTAAVPTIYDALIIGGGPAGLSAALALARVCRTSMVFDSGEYRNQGVEEMHTFLSRDGIHPDEFRSISRQQIQNKYWAQITLLKTRIVRVSNPEIQPGYKGFETVDTSGQTFLGKKLILATGTEDILPTDIEGYKENWPEHIHQCPFCDGYEHQSSPLGILTFPNPSYAHLAAMVSAFSSSKTIFTNGPPPQDKPTQTALFKVLALGYTLDERRIRRLVNNGRGAEKGITIQFETGEDVKLRMLFHRPAMRSRAGELIDQLGLEVREDGNVAVMDGMPVMQSSVRGCFVAGDVQEGVKQAVVAAGNGVRAAAGVVMQLCAEDLEGAER